MHVYIPARTTSVLLLQTVNLYRLVIVIVLMCDLLQYCFILVFVLLEIQLQSATVNELQLLEEFGNTIESEALLYITGYVTHRSRSSHPPLGLLTTTMEPLDKHDS